jgi:hypothetical protein
MVCNNGIRPSCKVVVVYVVKLEFKFNFVYSTFTRITELEVQLLREEWRGMQKTVPRGSYELEHGCLFVTY